jgi:hypothetical protein
VPMILRSRSGQPTWADTLFQQAPCLKARQPSGQSKKKRDRSPCRSPPISSPVRMPCRKVEMLAGLCVYLGNSLLSPQLGSLLARPILPAVPTPSQ